MTVIRSNLKSRWRLCFGGLASLLLVACAHSAPETMPVDYTSTKVEQAPIGSTGNGSSSLEINQIRSASSGFETRQISPSVQAAPLTVEQLQTYVDRCARGSFLPKGDLDCSELSLRIEDVLRSDDQVRNAMITLDRLGRNGSGDTGQDELEQNSNNLSDSAQGIASGFLEPPVPTELPKEPEAIDLDSILNAIGLGQNAAAIINSGG